MAFLILHHVKEKDLLPFVHDELRRLRKIATKYGCSFLKGQDYCLVTEGVHVKNAAAIADALIKALQDIMLLLSNCPHLQAKVQQDLHEVLLNIAPLPPCCDYGCE